jgi:DNA-binding IclR family transcriptional regulator
MTQISKTIKETIHLTIFKNDQGIIIESIESSASVRVAPPLGMPLPVNGGSTIAAIVAFLPPDRIEELCSQKLERFAPGTITDKFELINKLKKVKLDGFAYSCEEVHDGAWGVAAPIFNKNNEPIASLGISGPIFRLTVSLKTSANYHVIRCSKEITEKF